MLACFLIRDPCPSQFNTSWVLYRPMGQFIKSGLVLFEFAVVCRCSNIDSLLPIFWVIVVSQLVLFLALATPSSASIDGLDSLELAPSWLISFTCLQFSLDRMHQFIRLMWFCSEPWTLVSGTIDAFVSDWILPPLLLDLWQLLGSSGCSILCQ